MTLKDSMPIALSLRKQGLLYKSHAGSTLAVVIVMMLLARIIHDDDGISLDL